MSNKVSFIYIAVDKYSRVARKVGAITDSVRKKVEKSTGAFNKHRESVKKSWAETRKFGKSAKDLGLKLSAFATLPVLLLGRSLVKAASDSEETRSKFNTVFKDMSVQANKMADDLAKNFGLAGTKSRELLGNTGDLLTGFGFTQESAFDLAKQVNELAVDLASFTNFSGGAEGASAALTKALLGERESVKTLGISILEEDVKKKVQILRAQGMRFATMRQAKAFATLQIAQEQSANAIGDYNRTADQYANKVRLMSARTQDLKEKLGNILLPIALKIVLAVTSLTEKFTALSPTFQKIILVVLAVVAVLGPLLLIVGAIITAMPIITAGLAGLATAFLFLVSPVGLLLAAWAALGFALFKIKENWASIVSFISGSFESVVSKLSAVKEFFGFDGGDVNINKKMESIVTGGQQSRTDVNLNIRSPQGAVESVSSRTTGKVSGLNVGLNMSTAQ